VWSSRARRAIRPQGCVDRCRTRWGMGSLLNIVLGAALAVAIVLAFWLLLDFINGLQRHARRGR
jgi:hypothetical protein